MSGSAFELIRNEIFVVHEEGIEKTKERHSENWQDDEEQEGRCNGCGQRGVSEKVRVIEEEGSMRYEER